MSRHDREALRRAVIEECAQLIEDRFGERLQRRQATNCLRSLKEKPARESGR